MKTHILMGRESQSSLINYRKDASPFINLVTIIPIAWDGEEIAYYVGFQVDLVDQPSAILEKMKNGTCACSRCAGCADRLQTWSTIRSSTVRLWGRKPRRPSSRVR